MKGTRQEGRSWKAWMRWGPNNQKNGQVTSLNLLEFKGVPLAEWSTDKVANR